jgi:6-methylsalicylate decarboxylase
MSPFTGCGRPDQARSDIPGIMTERIDVHHHFYAPEVSAMLDARGELPAVSRAWSVENSLADMDRSNVEKALLSATPDADLSTDMARATNEYAAALVRQHPGRFGFFAALPIPDIDGCLKEIAYALDVLGAQGIGLFTSYGTAYLGDAALDPVFAELDRRKTIVYTHPTLNACCTDIVPGIPPTAIEFGTDTTRAIASLVFSGTTVNYPHIRFIFSHGGGTMPFLIGRFVNLAKQPRMAARLRNGLIPELQRFYYETAQVANRGAMASLRELVPASQVLFGTDFPYRGAEEQLAGLRQSGFSADELQAIEGPNLMSLLETAL